MVIGKLYNILPMSTAKQTLKDISPSVIIFDQLVKNVAYLSSQYNSIDKDVIVVGGKGTGKKYLVGLSAKLAKLRIVGGVV